MLKYYLGIDVSKGYADFIMLDALKHPVGKGFQLDDTADGHSKLGQYLTEFYHQYPDAEVHAAVESTGGYENNWYNRLVEFKDSFVLHVVRLNPTRVKYNSQASAKRNKTDAISAKDIAEYLISHREKIDYRVDNRFPMVRRQWTFIRLSLKQRTQLLNHLEALLYAAMPEVLNFCRNGTPIWVLRLLQQFPTYAAIKNVDAEQLAQIPYISLRKAKALRGLVQQGIGDSNVISGQIVSTIAAQALALDDQIKELKKLLEHNYQEAKQEVELLTTCKGIGVYSAVGLLMNMPPINNFVSAKKLASYWGIHPVYKQSGDGSCAWRMSKQGRSEPRAILYMVCLSAIQYNPIIKELYAQCMAKGMASKAALGVCMHKLVRIIYGMLKNQTAFDPQTDRNNKAKYQDSMKSRNTSPKSRHLQGFDECAPISNRQHKKRKKQTQSQGEYVTKFGIEEPVTSEVEHSQER